MTTQTQIIEQLPEHLRGFVRVQDYSVYTPRDHAVWRFLMHQLSHQMSASAHPVYHQGLKQTGISLEHVPSIEAMNTCLATIGWRALGVDGFIPPVVFMEFQARRILVIAMDMRTIDQMLYTPAPDILHESAGHAPFLIDVDYAEFLQQFGEIGCKAISSAADDAVYAAVRHLSVVKADPDSTPAEQLRAEQQLATATAENTGLSEAALLARLHWWTVEYGLVGTLSKYHIFGAGLLSSLGESTHCLDDEKVCKRLLTPDAVNQDYDISTEQKTLFVTHSCRHLGQVLDDVANGLAQRIGGAVAIRRAIASETVCTLEYSSGLQVSGRIADVHTDALDNVTYVQTIGESQLCFSGKQLNGHGREVHHAGFGSPVGYVNEFSRCLSNYSIDELRFAGIRTGAQVKLEFVSGIVVYGVLESILRADHQNILLSFSQCQVSDQENNILFQPDWGTFDMAVGTSITSVFGGSADPVTYPLHRPDPEPAYRVSPDAENTALFSAYESIRRLRGQRSVEELENITLMAINQYPDEWLLLFEIYELNPHEALRAAINRSVASDPDKTFLVNQGLLRLKAALP